MDNASERFRLDFKITVLSSDDDTHTISIRLDPDPARYEWQDHKGERYLYDKFDRTWIGPEAFQSLVEQIKGQPIFFQPSRIDDIKKYAQSRQLEIEKMLQGKTESPDFTDQSEEFLRELEINKLAFVILSIDLVGSTRLSQRVSPEKFARLVNTFVFEMSELVPLFNGYVLKYTGDGLIAYFPEPSFITMCDTGVSCAIAMRVLLTEALNPVLNRLDIPEISMRIGLDAGDAIVTVVGSPNAKQHMDVLGQVINIATKIESRAHPGGICIGAILERNLHVTWRELFTPVELDEEWPYFDRNGNPYGVFRLNDEKRAIALSESPVVSETLASDLNFPIDRIDDPSEP